MKQTRIALVGAALALAACSGMQPVTQDARDHFDTVQGMYGGNEFSPLSPEGERHFAGEKAAPAPLAAPAATPSSPRAAASGGAIALAAGETSGAPLGANANTRIAAAAPVPAGEGAAAPIAIDAHAFAAVFGADAALVQPSADQLLQLDSLSLVAAESLRVDLQEKILACRRAGERCRLARR